MLTSGVSPRTTASEALISPIERIIETIQPRIEKIRLMKKLPETWPTMLTMICTMMITRVITNSGPMFFQYAVQP